jgi:hypothetical protein
MAVDTGLFYELEVGDRLTVSRDRDSRLNRNAIVLVAPGGPVGHLQPDAARALGPELDAGLRAHADIVEVRMEPGAAQEIIVTIKQEASE